MIFCWTVTVWTLKGIEDVGDPQPPRAPLKQPPSGCLIEVSWLPWSQNALNVLRFSPNVPILLS